MSDLPHTEYFEVFEDPNSQGKQVSFEKEGDQKLISRILFLCPYGSHLYGTETEDSDFDFKGVFYHSFEDVVGLGNCSDTRRFTLGDSDETTDALDAGELDIELISLRKFLSDAMKGQTYAVELLHCPEPYQFVNSFVFEDLLDQKEILLTDSIASFLGYCHQQAERYSIRGQRLSDLRDIYSDMQEVEGQVEDFLFKVDPESYDHMEIVQQDLGGDNKVIDLLKIGNKKYNMHQDLDRVRPSIKGVIDDYGERVNAASEEGIDWKATYHAYRVAYELEELLQEGTLTFPLDKAGFLRSVKQGDIPKDRADREIPELVDRISEMENTLEWSADQEHWDQWLINLYREERKRDKRWEASSFSWPHPRMT